MKTGQVLETWKLIKKTYFGHLEKNETWKSHRWYMSQRDAKLFFFLKKFIQKMTNFGCMCTRWHLPSSAYAPEICHILPLKFLVWHLVCLSTVSLKLLPFHIIDLTCACILYVYEARLITNLVMLYPVSYSIWASNRVLDYICCICWWCQL